MKENGPFNLTVEDEKNFKEAVDLNKKAMCQFIQAFPTMSLLGKVNLQKKADKLFPCRRAWKMWIWNFKLISIQTIPSQKPNLN